MAPELTNGEINRKLDELLEGQGKTNEHLSKLNGRVGRTEQWIAIRDDREHQAAKRGSRSLTVGTFFAGMAALLVTVVGLILGLHGAAI